MQKTVLTPMSLRDFNRLEVLMSTMTGSRLPLASLVRHKLSTAIVTLAGEVNSKFVSEGCSVTFVINGNSRQQRRLSWLNPTNDNRELSFLQPLGLAMLGLKAGEKLGFQDDGRSIEVVVEDVRPETSCLADEYDELLSPHEDDGIERPWRLSVIWQHIRDGFVQWQRARVLRTLHGLNDALLADIGIKRDDVTEVASRVVRRSPSPHGEMCPHQALAVMRSEMGRRVMRSGAMAIVAAHSGNCSETCA